MRNGFSFELYGMIFENCYIYSSKYKSGNLQLSLFGIDPEINEMSCFVDITLDQTRRALKDNEIVVDCKYKPTLIPQLKDLGILKEQTGICVTNGMLYPVYAIDLTKIKERQYCMQELVAA